MPSISRSKPKRPSIAAAPRSVRSDGAETRQHILQVAGRVFADRGFARATSREICQTAGTNMAAVNYHFGGKEGLYDAVLVEAHGQLVRIDDLEAIGRIEGNPEAKLRQLFGLFVSRSAGPALPWAVSVLVHELMAPSRHVPVLLRHAVLPKIQLMSGLIAAALGVPAKHPVVQRALALVVLPCIMLAIAPRAVLGEALPTLLSNPQALADDMTAYAMAGLGALSRRHGAAVSGERAVGVKPARRLSRRAPG